MSDFELLKVLQNELVETLEKRRTVSGLQKKQAKQK